MFSEMPGQLVARFHHREQRIEWHYFDRHFCDSDLMLISLDLTRLRGIGVTALLDGGTVLTFEPKANYSPEIWEALYDADSNTWSRKPSPHRFSNGKMKNRDVYCLQTISKTMINV